MPFAPLTEGDRRQILATVEQLSSDAYRTLGQAYRPLGTASLAQVPGNHAIPQVMLPMLRAMWRERFDLSRHDRHHIDPPRTKCNDSLPKRIAPAFVR